MSVVNRMLQDIDRRVGATAFDAQSPLPDIRSVSAQAPRAGTGAWLGGAAVVLIAAGSLLAMNWAGGPWATKDPVPAAPQPKSLGQTSGIPPVVTVARSVEAAKPAALSEGATAPTVADSDSRPSTEASGPIESFRLSLHLSPLKTAEAQREPANPSSPKTAEPPRAAANPNSPKPAEPQRTSANLTSAKVAAPQREVASTVPAGKTVITLRHVAPGETVTAARLQWEEGSRAGALATLREALAVAEAAQDTRAVSLLARELARLELAANHPQAALDLLTRLAGILGEDADVLALRGNAQQRLGMHAQAADSYLAALRLRPTEGRWMLGAAISLAADGRKEEAQPWVERARDRGAITPPIATYLQQLGVPARQ